MSLRDTLNAARQEVQDAGGLPVGKEKDEGAEGFSRRSAARARPARDAGSTVRVVTVEDAKRGRVTGKRASEMTREERKADREAQRSAEDRRSAATTVLLNREASFKRRQRVWWIMLGVGFGLTIVSFVLTRLFPLQTDANLAPSVVAIVALVVAYVLIIAAFVYDWRKVRPLRKEVDAEVARMSDRKVERLLEEDARERAEHKAAKKRR